MGDTSTHIHPVGGWRLWKYSGAVEGTLRGSQDPNQGGQDEGMNAQAKQVDQCSLGPTGLACLRRVVRRESGMELFWSIAFEEES